ncbi:MAG TPA: sulfur carrier protein ThiS [Jatrophihabitantaceae bacterium]|nr:sulfur carrier protein ThiS [Jatrophihabitantaceae bacterium]
MVNGEARDTLEGRTLADVLTEVAGSLRGSAVVVDDAVVPRAQWDELLVRDGQRIEVITAVQGG